MLGPDILRKRKGLKGKDGWNAPKQPQVFASKTECMVIYGLLFCASITVIVLIFYLAGMFSAPDDKKLYCPVDGDWPRLSQGTGKVLYCAGSGSDVRRLRRRLCDSQGKWLPEQSTCVCPTTGEWRDTSAGNRAELPCHHPFHRAGIRSRFCNVDGSWMAPEDTCHVPPCPPSDGYGETAADQVTSISCPPGFTACLKFLMLAVIKCK
jgi:hypothetical protein